MTISPFACVGLVVLAVIGGLCVGVSIGLLVWFLYDTGKHDREMKQAREKIVRSREMRDQENQQVRRLLQSVFDNPEQGAQV